MGHNLEDLKTLVCGNYVISAFNPFENGKLYADCRIENVEYYAY